MPVEDYGITISWNGNPPRFVAFSRELSNAFALAHNHQLSAALAVRAQHKGDVPIAQVWQLVHPHNPLVPIKDLYNEQKISSNPNDPSPAAHSAGSQAQAGSRPTPRLVKARRSVPRIREADNSKRSKT